MRDASQLPSRPWTEIASEVSQEKDTTKLLKLVEELNRALAEQGIGTPRKEGEREHPGSRPNMA